jgi:hypothetical protein
LTDFTATMTPRKIVALDRALAIALDLDREGRRGAR